MRMKRLRNLILVIVGILMVSACNRMKPDQIAISKYPEIDNLFQNQADLLVGKKLRKEVWLEEESEEQVLTMDSASWEKELSFLEEINPNQPEYVGAFGESSDQGKLMLTLDVGERGVLKMLEFESTDEISSIKATIHEDKDVYVHHREIELKFSNQILSSYSIEGYQKIMLKDTVRFKISGIVQ